MIWSNTLLTGLSVLLYVQTDIDINQIRRKPRTRPMQPDRPRSRSHNTTKKDQNMPVINKEKERQANEQRHRASCEPISDNMPIKQCTDCAYFRISEKMIKGQSDERCFHPAVLHFGDGAGCVGERSARGSCGPEGLRFSSIDRASAAAIGSKMLYAVAKNQDGSVELTVYERSRACTVHLSKEMVAQLAGVFITKPTVRSWVDPVKEARAAAVRQRIIQESLEPIVRSDRSPFFARLRLLLRNRVPNFARLRVSLTHRAETLPGESTQRSQR
jgi:hypothetical protein